MTGENVVPTTQDVDPLLVKYLASREAVCPLCKYDLRGTTTDRCSECGVVLTLTIGAQPRPQAWYAMGVVGLSVGLGLHGTLACWMAWAYFTSNVRIGNRDITPTMISTPLLVIAIWVWIRCWLQLSTLRPLLRWGLVGFAWVLSACAIAWFFWTNS